MSFFGSGKSFPDQMPSILKIKVAGCKPEYGGVGLRSTAA